MTGAVHLFNTMKHEGIEPNVMTYNIMMIGFSKAKDPDSVHRLFAEMLKMGVKPNSYTFSTLIRACAINDDLTRAARLLSDMQQRYKIRPDRRTYTALMHVCAVAGQLSLAKKCLTRMQNEGIRRDVATYTTLIDAYAEVTTQENVNLHLEECRRLVDNMKSEMIPCDGFLYDRLIKLCIRGRQMQEAVDLVSKMEKEGLQPSVFTFSMLIDGLAKIPGISKEEAELKMNELLDEMSKRQLTLTVGSYTQILNLCCKLKDLDRAKEFFRQMKAAGVKPNTICYGTMMKCYERLGDRSKKEEYLKPCFDLVEELATSGLALSSETLTQLIRTCANARDIERARQAWTLVEESGVADRLLFGDMIRTFLRLNDLQGAFQVLYRMESNGVVRNQAVCFMFLQFFAHRKMKTQARQFLKETKLWNVRMDKAMQKLLKDLDLT